MKTKRIRQLTSFNISLPDSWAKLTVAQFEFLCLLMATQTEPSHIPVMMLMHIAGLKPVGRIDGNATILEDRRCRSLIVDDAQIALAAEKLEFLSSPSASLIRNGSVMAHLMKLGCIDMLRRPFGEFLAADTLFNALVTERSAAPSFKTQRKFSKAIFAKSKKRKLSQTLDVAAFIYYSSFKDYIIKKFTHLFSASDSSAAIAPKSVADSVNAQIRALTKGDVTAEQRVLETQTVRALTELNELAREYAELKALEKK